jgi:hypothetical protein
MVNRLVLLLLIAVMAAVWFYLSGPTGGNSGGDRAGIDNANPGSARAELEDLRVSEPGSMSGYSREKFEHWSDAQEFGWDAPDGSCDVRDAALIRDGENVVVGDGCKIESGTWVDPYTTTTYTDPQDIDIDHVVPLANAWRSGASAWNDDEREAYANAPDVLLSVEDDANQQKGDKGPEVWKPPNKAIWCDYATRWIAIKYDYNLSVNPQEKDALTEMLDTCGGG